MSLDNISLDKICGVNKIDWLMTSELLQCDLKLMR